MVASCWIFLYELYYDGRIHEHQAELNLQRIIGWLTKRCSRGYIFHSCKSRTADICKNINLDILPLVWQLISLANADRTAI